MGGTAAFVSQPIFCVKHSHTRLIRSARRLHSVGRRSGMNKVATVSWWSVLALLAIVILALIFANR